MDMSQVLSVDATIIVAIIGLFGTIYTSKTNAILQHNKRLIKMVENQQEEIRELREQHAEECRRLEEKITTLTEENNDLRKEVMELKVGLGIFNK